jgi:hypothetical protein
MDPQVYFGISIVLSFLVWGLVSAQYLWPALHTRPGPERFRPILLLHGFRFVGAAFLVPGVVSADLPAAFAEPAAYGDLIACLLALAALAALNTRPGPVLLWLFNLWGAGDLLYAYDQGLFGTRLQVGQLEAGYFIPTLVVPLLLITHGMAFRMLLRAEPTQIR